MWKRRTEKDEMLECHGGKFNIYIPKIAFDIHASIIIEWSMQPWYLRQTVREWLKWINTISPIESYPISIIFFRKNWMTAFELILKLTDLHTFKPIILALMENLMENYECNWTENLAAESSRVWNQNNFGLKSVIYFGYCIHYLWHACVILCFKLVIFGFVAWCLYFEI